MSRALPVFCLLLASALFLSGGQQRVWHYTDGRSFSAEYQWSGGEALHLKNKQGKEFNVPLGALCNADLEYIRGIQSTFRTKGVLWHAPLVWEEFRSKNFTSQEAQKAGYYPLDSRVTSEGTLRIEFRRFGPAPKLAPGQGVVLRMTTARRGDSGTGSTIQVGHRGGIAGHHTGVGANSTFDIPLSPAVLLGGERIILDVRCGSDTVHLRTRNSGAGPYLLIVDQNPE